jgi:hypothetical protein
MTILTLDVPLVNLDRCPPAPLVEPDELRPTAGPDPEPSPLDQAEWLGMSLALAGEPMAEMITNSTGLLLRFAIGQFLGMEVLRDERDADLERTGSEAERMESAFADPADLVHQCERSGVC